MRYAIIPFFLIGVACGNAAAIGGDTRENVTHSAASTESKDQACSLAAKRLKSNVGANGWKIITKGDVPCDCKSTSEGWSCSITALVEKPEDEAARD